MAKFFIGQKVKVKYVHRTKNSYLVGREDFISEVNHNTDEVLYGLKSSPIEYKYYGLLTTVWGFKEDQLEPILPEGAQPCGISYEQMMEEFKEKLS